MEKKSQRLLSIDALRGFDMLFIMGFSSLVVAVCSLFPGGADCWLATTMGHAKWHGFTHHDTIFPLFLFLAGMSFPFSYAKQVSSGVPTREIYLKIVKRAIILICLGVVYNGFFKLDFEKLRICSVLGRIGLAWMCAAILYINFKPKTRAIICAAILVGYWLLIRFVPAPDTPGADPLSMQGNLIGYIDRLITPGRLIYDGGRFDPEGLLSTIPAVVSAMLGIFTGEFVRIPEEKISGANRNSERQVLTECLEYCFSKNVKILLISELSRLGRNVDEVLKNVMLCKENKLNVYFQKETLSIFDDSGKEHPFLTIFIAIQFLHNRCLFYYTTTSYEAFCSCFAWRNFSCIVGLP
jgi:hypothetical protein